MAPCCREHVNRGRVGTVGHGRQVTDHATGPVCQCELDALVQVLGYITKRAGNLKDGYLPDRVSSGPHLPTFGRTAG
jgi:hypothetical protein